LSPHAQGANKKQIQEEFCQSGGLSNAVFFVPTIRTADSLTGGGALKMTDMKMTDHQNCKAWQLSLLLFLPIPVILTVLWKIWC